MIRSKPKGRKSKSRKNASLPATSSLPDLTKVKKEEAGEEESEPTAVTRIKQEAVEDEEGLKTPAVSSTMDTPASSFVNSLKVRGQNRQI